jgi:hypothetical protein
MRTAMTDIDVPFFDLQIVGCDGPLYVQHQLVVLKNRCQNITKLQWTVAAQKFELEELRAFALRSRSRRRGLVFTNSNSISR